MYSFRNDYSEGAHPRILEALAATNLEQCEGYGKDIYTADAIELLKKRIGRDDIDIHLLSGGTQTNLTALSVFLRPHEAVIAADTGHISGPEAGAIEATGHKVISIKVNDGKLNPSCIKTVLDEHISEHMVKPRLVYITDPTEVGTIYLKNELIELSDFCKSNNLLLYVDGARLGSAICSEENDLQLSDFGTLTDAFYIGATKNGALIGEALVICRDSLKDEFKRNMRQRGALLAKGRLIGIQFIELFRDDLYYDLARHANRMAGLLRDGIKKAGYTFLAHSSTNQIFPILPKPLISLLQQNYLFNVRKDIDPHHAVIRLITSWATKEEAVLAFLTDIEK